MKAPGPARGGWGEGENDGRPGLTHHRAGRAGAAAGTGHRLFRCLRETLEEAAAAVPHGTIRVSTAGAIRARGGDVKHRPELTRTGVMNERHVDIREGKGPTTFSEPFPSPVPKSERIQ